MFEQLLNGIILGSIYALLGCGLTLIYGTMRVLNFAHGEFYMLGGYAFFILTTSLGLNSFLAVPLVIAIVFCWGALLAWLIVRPLLERPGWDFSTIAATLGMSIALQNIALAIWGEKFQSVPYFIDGMVEIGGYRIPVQRLLIVVGAFLAMGATAALLRYTRLGWAVRATAQDPEAAKIMGIPTAWISVFSFALGSALAAYAAAILAPIYAINPWMGVPLALKAFAVVVMGGLGSFAGSVVAGLILGLVEAIGVSVLSSEWREVVSFCVLIAVVWFRPWGLFGVKRVQS